MLTESYYLVALYVYLGAAGILVVSTAWWLRHAWPPFWVLLAVLVLAALLLTPAYPGPGVTTLAPALVVAGFQLLTDGPEAARHAIRPLLFMLAIGFGIAVLLHVLVFRRRRRARLDDPAPVQPDA